MFVATSEPPSTPGSSRPRSSFIDDILMYAQPGDLLLAGGNDWISRCIKIGSRSIFCHVAVFLSEDEVIESYDKEFTPDETDDGVVAISLRDFLARDLTDLKIIRPLDIDVERLSEVAGTFTRCSAPYPSVGSFVAAACLATNPVLTKLPGPIRRPILTAQVRLAGDGAIAMHCAESASRLYHATGVELEFPNPMLAPQIEHTRNYLGLPIQPLRKTRRDPTSGRWPRPRNIRGLVNVTGFGLREIVSTVRKRWNQPPDEHDFLLPVDMDKSPSFSAVASSRRIDGQWTPIGAL